MAGKKKKYYNTSLVREAVKWCCPAPVTLDCIKK